VAEDFAECGAVLDWTAMSTLEPEPERLGGLGTLTEPVPQTSHGDGDHERFAHYADKDKIMESTVSGTPLVALCGKVWVPSRDPKKYPVCPTCKEIWEHPDLD
jgi:hypothetical protein